MSQPALSLDDIGYQDLRIVADRLLETTRVEYVDEGVLLVMNPPGIEHRRIVRAIVDDVKRAELLSRPVDQDRLGGFGLGVLAGPFDQFSVDEGRSGADQGDEMRRVHTAPAVLR